jgi:hypothetical protein
MSAIQNVVVPKTEIKVKKPYLPAKYEKNLVFGYWLIENLKAKEMIQDTLPVFEFLHLFADVNTQKGFLDTFFEEQKSITKEMKALIRNHNKPAKKPPAPKKVAPADGAEPKRRGRKKVVKDEPVLSEQDQIISDLVAAANTTEPEVKEPVKKAPVKRAPAKKEAVVVADKKEAAVAATNTLIANSNLSPIADPVRAPAKKAPKEKVVKEKVVKEKVVKDKAVVNEKPAEVHVATVEEEEDTEEVEIEATPFTFQGVDYLMDGNNTLYDSKTFDVVGRFDAETQTIVKA